MAIAGLFVERPKHRRDDVSVVKPRRYETRAEVEAEIGQAVAALSALTEIEAEWDDATKSVRRAIRECGDTIKRTHHAIDVPHGVAVTALNLSDEAKAERRALFAESDGMRRQFAPELREYDQAKRGLKQAKDAVNTLRSVLKHWKDPKPESPPKRAVTQQMSLF